MGDWEVNRRPAKDGGASTELTTKSVLPKRGKLKGAVAVDKGSVQDLWSYVNEHSHC